MTDAALEAPIHVTVANSAQRANFYSGTIYHYHRLMGSRPFGNHDYPMRERIEACSELNFVFRILCGCQVFKGKFEAALPSIQIIGSGSVGVLVLRVG